MASSPVLLAQRFFVQTAGVDDAEAFVLPAGTVTFLLTDVEGSTAWWRDRPAEMGPAIARHYEILDEAVVRFGGVRPVEQGEGDSVVAAFPRAVDALNAAIEAQRALQAAVPWLAVRMAVHSGDAQLRGSGNYVGRTIIRCARLRACAHGGQILVSETAAPLLQDALPEGVTLVDLGVARLRDMGRPERVWQAAHPELRREFPPLRSLDAAPHNLPTPLTSFVGREDEELALAALVTSHRLVTVTGAGGAGKTRLAIQVAASLVDEHPGGTWWVELAPAAAAGDVGQRIAASLGLLPTAGVDPFEQVRWRCGDGGVVLLVIDNAEHVLDEVSGFVHRLVAACPSVRVLVTSREPIGVPGEVVWRVPSLSSPAEGVPIPVASLDAYDAARLFLERARAARPNLEVDDRAAPYVAQICARLDGIPLAIELAAARARSMTLQAIADGLSDAFRLLTGGARTLLPRQQTLAASIAWSVELLDPVEAAVFRRLSVFPTSFTLDSAEAVAADGAIVDRLTVLDVVTRLVDKSLVQFDAGSGRYSLLLTLRQYGLGRLRDAEEAMETRDRHARWFAEWAGTIDEGWPKVGYRQAAVDLPNIDAALDWSYASAPALVADLCVGASALRSRFASTASREQQFAWVLSFDRRADEVSWARAVAGTVGAAWLHQRRDVLGLVDDARALLQDDGRLCAMLDGPPAIGRALQNDRRELEGLLARARTLNDEDGITVMAGSLAWVSAKAGDLPAAAAYLDEVRACLRTRTGPLDYDVAEYAFIADYELALVSGDLHRATEVAVGLTASGMEYDHALAADTALLALARDDRALMAKAKELIARPVSPTLGHLDGQVRALDHVLERRWAAAVEDGLPAWEASRPNGLFRGTLFVPLVVALLAAGRTDAEAIVAAWRVELREIGDPPLPLARLLTAGAHVHLTAGRAMEALDAAHELLDIARSQGLVLSCVDALELVSRAEDERGNARPAARLLGAADAERDRLGYVGRLGPDPAAEAARRERLRDDHAAAYEEGGRLPLAAAADLARRSRGRRDRPATGWASLTPTERQVVALVAEGRSNAAIAEQLVMSVATVKSHLTHVYTKTGVSSRAELVASVARGQHEAR